MRTIRSADNTPLRWTSSDDRVADNVRNILRIWQGEAAFVRPMGIDTDAPGRHGPTEQRKLTTSMRENIAEYEPDAVVLDVRVLLDAMGNAVIEVDLDE